MHPSLAHRVPLLLVLLLSGGLAVPPAGATPPATPAPARHAWQRMSSGELAAIRAIRENGRARVGALAKEAELLPAGPAREDVLKRVEAVKRETWVQVLQASAGFARARGDVARAIELEAAAERVLHPPQAPASPVESQPRATRADGRAR